MRLVFDLEPRWPTSGGPEGLDVRVAPQITLTVRPVEPLPWNTAHWGDRIVLGNAGPTRVKVLRLDDRQTHEGFPVTLVESDVVDAAGQPQRHRLHALYRFFQHGCVVEVGAPSAGALAPLREELLARLLGARVDTSRDVACLAHVWQGLELVDKLEIPEIPPPPTRTPRATELTGDAAAAETTGDAEGGAPAPPPSTDDEGAR